MSAREGAKRDDEQQLELLDAIIETIPNMIFVKDAERLAFVRVNRAGELLLGLKSDELRGKTDYDLFSAEDAAFFQSKDRETLNARTLVDIHEERLETKDGVRWLHTKKVPLLDRDGQPRYLLGISEDITEWKAQAAELRTAKARAEAATRELESFSYSVAHDLRAPLRGMDGFSQALLEDHSDQLDATAKRYLRNIRLEAQRMARLIDDLLTLSRVSRTDLTRQRTDLSDVARAILGRLARAEPQREVDFVIQDDLLVDGDSRLLEIALTHLLDNAWKFTSKRPRAKIELGTSVVEGESCFFVRDDGAGFDMAYYDKLFEPFHRLHTATEFDGTGVGLATVERVMRRHGGRVWATGQIDRGATFYFIVTPTSSPMLR